VSQGLVVIPTDTASAAQKAKYAAYVESRLPRTASPQGPARMMFAPDLLGSSAQIAEALYGHGGFREGRSCRAVPCRARSGRVGGPTASGGWQDPDVRLRIALVAGVVLVAGCGGGEDTAAPAPTPSSAAPTRGSGVSMLVTSTAFADGQRIPDRFTCRGAGDAPDVSWKNVPAEAKSVALVVNDPDAGSDGFLHWVIYDLPPGDGTLTGDRPPSGANEGDNGAGRPGWTPLCPPSGTHHYVFTVYALPGPPSGTSSPDLIAAMERTYLSKTQLTGLVPT
jgi:Raf kinase inhibitor-like YbhB/YbcL family protein